MSKAVKRAVFHAFFALILGNCVLEPLSLKAFAEHPDVDKDKVVLINGSEGTAGNKSITGLSTGKYYIVEQWDGTEGDTDKTRPTAPPDNIYYVSAGGTLGTALVGIGRTGVATISGLTNFDKYNVKAAQEILYTIDDDPPPATETIPTEISGSTDVLIVKSDGTKTVSPPLASITVEAPGTVTDYVFVDVTATVNFSNFYVWRVTVQPASSGEDLTINVTFTISGGSLTLTPNIANYTYADFDASAKLIINLTAPALAPGDVVLWKLGSTTLTSLSALPNVLEIDPHTYPELMVAGTHVITVVIGEASGTITLTIDDS